MKVVLGHYILKQTNKNDIGLMATPYWMVVQHHLS